MRGPVLSVFLVLVVVASGAQAQPTFPDRSWAADTVGRIISPRMDDGSHHNQPAAVGGALLLAGNAQHSLWDVSDPTRPVRLSAFESPHHDGEAESHQLAFVRDADGTVYALMISGRGIDVFDVTDVMAPMLVSSLELEGIDYGDNTDAVWGVTWIGDTIYAGGTNTGIHVIDARDPAALSVVRRVPTAELGGVDAGPLFALGNLLVVTTPKERAGIATVDLTDPRAPALLDAIVSDDDSYIGGFYGGHAFLVDPFRAYDVTTDPRDIQLTSSTETPDSEYVSFGDHRLILGSLRPNPGAYVYDLADVRAPVMLRRLFGRTDTFAGGRLNDDQFTIPIGNLVVLSDDELDIGSVIAVADARRDSMPPEVMLTMPRDGATAQPLSTAIAISLSDQIDLRHVTPETLIVRPIGGAALPVRVTLQHTVLVAAPRAPLSPDTTYEVVLPAGGVTDLVGNAIATEHRITFSTGDGIAAPTCRILPLSPVRVGADASLGAADAGAGASYEWTLGATGPTPTGQAITHAFDAAGRHLITLTVRTGGASRTCSAIQIVHTAPAERAPSRASTVALSRGDVIVVNPDADTVAAVDRATLEVRWEHDAGDHPRTLASAPDGSIWVAAQDDDAVVVLDADGARIGEIALRYGAAPYGVAIDPTGATALITLEGTGELAIADVASRAITGTIPIGAPVRGIAIHPDGSRAYLARSVSPADRGEVIEIDLASRAVARTIALAIDPGPDEDDSGRGVPNVLGAIAISPDGATLLVPSKKDNVERGLARDGEELDDDNTVRTIVSAIALASGTEVAGARVDLDDHDMASAVAWSPLGDLFFVATQGTNRVDVYDAAARRLVGGFATGLAPQGLWLEDGRLYVQSFLDRTLDVYDVSGLLAGTDGAARSIASVRTVAVEPLAPDVLLGKQIFYNADDPRMSADGYLACATCHLEGGSDGRVWDFTDRGEGWRDTIDLRGRAGTAHGPLHWTANFDEVQDFENDVRARFGGSGLMHAADFAETEDPLGEPKAGRSEALDALAAYVASLDRFPRSPYREPDGSMTADALAGRAIFESLGCRGCHAGEALTDSAAGVLHDVGTIRPTSGTRRGEPLTGIDTPTLRGLFATAPYFHDGSAATLDDVLAVPEHGDAQSLDDADRALLVRFLLELDNDVLGYVDPVPVASGCSCGVRTRGIDAWPLALVLALAAVRIASRARRRTRP